MITVSATAKCWLLSEHVFLGGEIGTEQQHKGMYIKRTNPKSQRKFQLT